MPAAARKDDAHTCPMTTGTTPHVGGPIKTGAGKVKIQGKEAARWLDMAKCNGPPDYITGNVVWTVWINWRPAAMKGSTTLHGGVVTSGATKVKYLG